MCCIRKDLLKTQHFLGLMLCTASNITARIPLQSAARTSLADSFSPGEAIGAVAPHDTVNSNLSYQKGGCNCWLLNFQGKLVDFFHGKCYDVATPVTKREE